MLQQYEAHEKDKVKSKVFLFKDLFTVKLLFEREQQKDKALSFYDLLHNWPH